DNSASPGGEQSSPAPVPREAKIEPNRHPDQKGSEPRDHRHDTRKNSPEEMVRHAQNPVGEPGEHTLHACDGEASESSRENRVADTSNQPIRLLLLERKQPSDESKGKLPVAEEKEEDEEHH